MKYLPLLLGHRGTRASSLPENTIPSFELALHHGCDGFEFDVRSTLDGYAVLCHDAKSKGRSLAKTPFAQLSHLPLLETVLARFRKRAFLNIELKVPGLEQNVIVAISEHSPEKGFLVSSFLPEVLVDLRARSELIPLGIICDERLPAWQDVPVNYVIPHHSLVSANLVGQVHEAGKHIMTWTVNDRASMLRFAEWGVDGIISDDTELLVQTLRPERSSPKKQPPEEPS